MMARAVIKAILEFPLRDISIIPISQKSSQEAYVYALLIQARFLRRYRHELG